MIVSIILDTEYMGVAERNKWFLKNISTAVKEDMLIVTHSYFKDKLKEIVEGCADRFYREFEMDRVPLDEIEKLDICYLPDEWFDSIYEECGSRTKQLIRLYNENDERFEKYIEECIDKALQKRGEAAPEFILNSLHVFKFVKAVARHYECPIIPWVFSAVRKVHGYAQTLYMAHIDEDLFNSRACEELYKRRESDDLGFSILSKQEILAFIGKSHNFPLLPLIDRVGVHEVGIVEEGFHITPEIYQNDSVTDDDLHYECKRILPPGSTITRLHPIQLDKIGVGRNNMKDDPVAFVLSCKRIMTVQSQMIIKAAMWNRAPIAMSNALPYSCLLSSKLKDAIPVSDYDLNFILFVYFVPDQCMFNIGYWKWRLTNPSIYEIATRHIDSICSNLSISPDIIYQKDGRLEKILRSRGLNDRQIKQIVEPEDIEDVPLDYPTAHLKCYLKDESVISLFALNHKSEGWINSSFTIPNGCVKCSFIPQNDSSARVLIGEIKIGNRSIPTDKEEKYYLKNQSVIDILISEKDTDSFIAKWNVNN